MDELKAKLLVLAAALGGGFVGQYISDEPLTAKQRVGFIIAGACTALFLIPWGLNYFGVSGAEAASGASFIAGMYWKKVVIRAGDAIDALKLPWAKRNDE